MNLVIALLAGLLVLDVALDALNRVLRRYERKLEAEWRRRVLRDLARHE
jgi:flavin-dependent dehydrogenase